MICELSLATDHLSINIIFSVRCLTLMRCYGVVFLPWIWPRRNKKSLPIRLELNWPACRLQRLKAKINRALAYKSGIFFLCDTRRTTFPCNILYARAAESIGCLRGLAQKRRPARGLQAAQEKRSCEPATLKLLLLDVRARPTGYRHSTTMGPRQQKE